MVEPPDVVDLQTGYGGFVLLDERFLLVRFLGDVVVTGDEDYDRFEDFVGDVIHGLQLGIRHGIELSVRYSQRRTTENGFQMSIRDEAIYIFGKPECAWGALYRGLIAINSFCFFCAREKETFGRFLGRQGGCCRPKE